MPPLEFHIICSAEICIIVSKVAALLRPKRLPTDDLSFQKLLTETATVVGGTLIVALREPSAAVDALIIIGFTYRRITTGSQFYSSILVRDRHSVYILAGLDSLPGIHWCRGYSHAQDKHPNRAYFLETLQMHVNLLGFYFSY